MTEGIKETKEAVVGLIKVGKVIVDVVKDGVQFSDIAILFDKFLNDEELKKALSAAIADAEKIPAEIKNIDFLEGSELLIAILGELNKK